MLLVAFGQLLASPSTIKEYITIDSLKKQIISKGVKIIYQALLRVGRKGLQREAVKNL